MKRTRVVTMHLIFAILLLPILTAAQAAPNIAGSSRKRIARGGTSAFLVSDRAATLLSGTLEQLHAATAPARFRLRVAPLTATTESVRLNNDANQDTEPAIGVDIQGANETDYIAWMRWDYVFNTSVQGAVVQRVNGTIVQTSLINPAHNYANSGDPVVVVNRAGSGLNPHRAYLFYTDFNPAVASTITMSSSQNNFITATTVWSDTSPGVMLDKPAAAVSEYAGSLGDVYCVFVEIRGDGTSRILLCRLNPATGQFYLAGEVPLPFYHPYIHSPSIVIDPANGHLYVSYMDQVNNILYMVHGTPSQGSVLFDAPSAAGPDVVFYHKALGLDQCAQYNQDCPDRLDFAYGATQAVSMISSKYNNADHSIGVVYHGYASGVTHVLLARYVPGATYPWQGTRQIVPGSTEEQWNGALDDDPQGHYVISYYERPTGSAYYRTCSRLTTADGTSIGSPSCAAYVSCGTCQPIYPTLGEYQDVVYANGVWRAATVHQSGGDNSNYDIYHLTIQP